MSDEFSRHDNDDVPRFEPWLGVLAGAVVPVALGVALPRFLIPLSVASGALFVLSMVMLKLQARKLQ